MPDRQELYPIESRVTRHALYRGLRFSFIPLDTSHVIRWNSSTTFIRSHLISMSSRSFALYRILYDASRSILRKSKRMIHLQLSRQHMQQSSVLGKWAVIAWPRLYPHACLQLSQSSMLRVQTSKQLTLRIVYCAPRAGQVVCMPLGIGCVQDTVSKAIAILRLSEDDGAESLPWSRQLIPFNSLQTCTQDLSQFWHQSLV